MSNKIIDKFIILTGIFKKENDIWTAECPELGTATFANTLEEAKEDLGEAILLHLSTLEEVGECKRFLKENNIKIYRKPPQKIKTELPINPDIFTTRSIQPIHAYC